MSKQNYTEEFSVNGDQVVEKVKQLIKEGNVRRIASSSRTKKAKASWNSRSLRE